MLREYLGAIILNYIEALTSTHDIFCPGGKEFGVLFRLVAFDLVILRVLRLARRLFGAHTSRRRQTMNPDSKPPRSSNSDTRIPTDAAVVLREDFRPDPSTAEQVRMMLAKKGSPVRQDD